jgi:hypothetical protein
MASSWLVPAEWWQPWHHRRDDLRNQRQRNLRDGGTHLRRRRDHQGTAYYLDASDKGTYLLGEEG